jgi:hypothetical protein
MRPTAPAIIAGLALLSACNRSADHQPTASAQRAVNDVANGAAPAAPTSLLEPKESIDPKSVEAAGEVVQHYGALVKRAQFLQAEPLWTDLEAARAFAVALDARFKDVHVEIGALGATEGAAGSIYTTVPATFSGTSERGQPLRLPASIILRRVNDVTGSTERQRRWHIERIDWQDAG